MIGLHRRTGSFGIGTALMLFFAADTASAIQIDSREFDHAGTFRSIDIASCGVWINTGTFMMPAADRAFSWSEDQSGPLGDLAYTISSFEISDVNHVDGQPIGVVNKINPNLRNATNPFGGIVTIKGHHQGQEVTLLTGTVENNPINEFSHRGYFSRDPKTGTWSCGTVLCQNNLVSLDLLVQVTGGVFRNLFSEFFLEGRFQTRRTFGDDFEAHGAFSLFLPGEDRTEPNPVPEPSSLMLLVCAGAGALRRFRATVQRFS